MEKHLCIAVADICRIVACKNRIKNWESNWEINIIRTADDSVLAFDTITTIIKMVDSPVILM